MMLHYTCIYYTNYVIVVHAYLYTMPLVTLIGFNPGNTSELSNKIKRSKGQSETKKGRYQSKQS